MDFCLLLKVWVKNISKNFSGKISQELLDHAKQCVTDALKTASKKIIQKLAEATGYLIGNKITDAVDKSYDGNITRVSKTSL